MVQWMTTVFSRAIQDQARQKILHLYCGNGHDTLWLSKHAPQALVLGIDTCLWDAVVTVEPDFWSNLNYRFVRDDDPCEIDTKDLYDIIFVSKQREDQRLPSMEWLKQHSSQKTYIFIRHTPLFTEEFVLEFKKHFYILYLFTLNSKEHWLAARIKDCC